MKNILNVYDKLHHLADHQKIKSLTEQNEHLQDQLTYNSFNRLYDEDKHPELGDVSHWADNTDSISSDIDMENSSSLLEDFGDFLVSLIGG